MEFLWRKKIRRLQVTIILEFFKFIEMEYNIENITKLKADHT